MAFLLLAWLATVRLVREPTAAPADVLGAVSPRPRALTRSAVVALFAALIFIHSYAFNGIHTCCRRWTARSLESSVLVRERNPP